jgi:hypothetical protein
MSVTQKVVGCLRSNVLTILNIAGVFSGVVLALALRSSREEKWTQREIVYVGFVGELRLGTCNHGVEIRVLSSDIFQSSLMSLDGARVSKMRANDRLTQPASIGSGNPLSSTPTNPMKPKASYVCLVSYTPINCLCLCRQTVCERSISFFFFGQEKKKEFMGHA